ncbi:MAG TPA: hypothetical protein VJY33_26985 [Isosphaeraceae bacterium]|nr:hypothetical protein [Isosphaeraceae bacterium]
MNDEATTMGRLILGFILGVIASIVLGGLDGLIFWALSSDSLPDWPLAGTLFGLVVGGVGAITTCSSGDIVLRFRSQAWCPWSSHCKILCHSHGTELGKLRHLPRRLIPTWSEEEEHVA